MPWATSFEPHSIAGHGLTGNTVAKRVWLGDYGPVVYRSEIRKTAARALAALDETLARDANQTQLARMAQRGQA